jgi:hypothetical protein
VAILAETSEPNEKKEVNSDWYGRLRIPDFKIRRELMVRHAPSIIESATGTKERTRFRSIILDASNLIFRAPMGSKGAK